MKKILVIGASGFVGGHLARSLLADGRSIRCLARNPARASDLATTGCEVVQGDISDLASVQRALDTAQAVYVSIHTLSPQPANTAHQGFMDVESDGLRNIVTACRAHGVRRLIYVTFLGVAHDAPSAWVRGRWEAEQSLLDSGLDVTVIRPGMIVGVGGRGFDTAASQARRRVAITLAGNRPKMRTIAIDDLIYYFGGVLDDPRTYQQCYDVGNDDVLTMNQTIDITAEILGGRPPRKIQIPRALLVTLAPLIERMSKLPRGAVKGFVDGLKTDAIGDPMPIRAILPRPLLSFRQAAERALAIP